MLSFIKFILIVLVVALVPSGFWYGVISLIQFAVNKSGGDATWMQVYKYWICGAIYVVFALYFAFLCLVEGYAIHLSRVQQRRRF